MPPDPQPFQFGSITFPLDDQSAGASLLAVCDPGLSKLLSFLEFEIDSKLDTALTGALSAKVVRVGKNIAKTLSVEPIAKHTKADSLDWPLFAMWRDTSRMSGRTLNWRQDEHTLGWCYCLPPMTLEYAQKFAHVLHAVVDIVNGALHHGWDPLYNSGERIVGGNNLSSAKCTTAKYGPYLLGDQTDTLFYSVFGEILLVEQTMPNTTGLTPFAGMDLVVTQQAGDDVATVVAANAAIGNTTIQVASSEGFNVLDVAIFGFGTVRQETASITAIPDATHITIAAPGLIFAHTALQADAVKRNPVTIVTAKSDVG